MKLATIEKISEVIQHPNADRLTIYKMDGMAWRVISAEKFEVGDLVVYVKTDTVVPEKEEFEFLRKNKFRVNCIRLRGEYSNGLILPITLCYDEEEIGNFEGGEDVTERLGITKYEKPVSYQSGDVAGSFPTHLVPKTDEERIENYPKAIEYFKGKEVYVSVKHDGSSETIINHKEDGFKVCSRNLEIKESENSKYWQPVFKYNLRDKIPVGYAIQFELVGEGIQKNPEGLKGVDISVFNVWRLEDRKLLDYQDFVDFCTNAGIPTANLYYVGEFKWDTVEDMIEEAKKAKYPNGEIAEGLVWRLKENQFDDRLQKSLSVKTINYNYKD
jgi:RNA ligase (TIGR02306 family)